MTRKYDKILVCPDSFKGCMTAHEAAIAIGMGLKEAGFSGEIRYCELSDGGEGFNSIIYKNSEVDKIEVKSCDALGREIQTFYLYDFKNKIAYIESAKTIGLELLSIQEMNPLVTSSKGLGLMIRHALECNARDIYISLGGSAVNDGGMGMMTALGMKFITGGGKILIGNGKNLSDIRSIDISELDYRLRSARIHAVCDVENPLLGKTGATEVFAPQKGAAPDDIPFLESGMINLCEILVREKIVRINDKLSIGAGAAGGIGYMLQSVLKAEYLSGIDFIKQMVGFGDKVKDIDMIITGEGCVDRQSVMGKVLSGILKEAKNNDIPLITFGGIIKDPEFLKEQGVYGLVEIYDPLYSYEENMKKSRAMNNLTSAAARFFSSLS